MLSIYKFIFLLLYKYYYITHYNIAPVNIKSLSRLKRKTLNYKYLGYKLKKSKTETFTYKCFGQAFNHINSPDYTTKSFLEFHEKIFELSSIPLIDTKKYFINRLRAFFGNYYGLGNRDKKINRFYKVFYT